MKKDGIVNIRGTEYQTVGLRVSNLACDLRLREMIQTERVHSFSVKTIQLEETAEYIQCKRILDIVIGGTENPRTGEGGGEPPCKIHGEGIARIYKAGNANDAEILQKVETKAFGRALASIGYLGEEFQIASAEEVEGVPTNEEAYRKSREKTSPVADKFTAVPAPAPMPDYERAVDKKVLEIEEKEEPSAETDAEPQDRIVMLRKELKKVRVFSKMTAEEVMELAHSELGVGNPRDLTEDHLVFLIDEIKAGIITDVDPEV